MIITALKLNREAAKIFFIDSASIIGTRFFYLDNLLPSEIALKIADCFPKPDDMRVIKSYRESKYTSKNMDDFHKLIKDTIFAFQDKDVISMVEEITGIGSQIPDPSFYAGGLSLMKKDDFLGPHIDNSHDYRQINYRTLNLLYYVTPKWEMQNGGNLELWDKSVSKKVTVESRFNRLVVMETNPSSWHSVSKVMVDKSRKCISNYYFSTVSPTGHHYRNVTSFSASKDETFKRLLLKVDSISRNLLRSIIPGGLSKKDLYLPKKD
jgi:Rps23 Pro-64 3,4-dihydroxylase Tpa1-like proline 4-hydroxylase